MASSKAASQAGLSWPLSPALAAGAWQGTAGQPVLLLQGHTEFGKRGALAILKPSNLQFVSNFFVVK